MSVLELNFLINIKLGNAQQYGFIFFQINKLTLKVFSDLSNIIIHYYLKLQLPIMHRHFLGKLSQNPEYVQTHCTDRRKPFYFILHVVKCFYMIILNFDIY